MKSFFKSQRGQSLIELLVTIGLAAVLLPALLTGFVASRSGRAQQDQRLQATAFLKETQEAIRIVRENDWTTFAAKSTGAVYHPVSGTSWTLATGSETNGDPVAPITRQVVINDVCRDFASGVILPAVSSCAGADPYNDSSTKKVTITVSWGLPTATSIKSTEYLTRTTSLSYGTPLNVSFSSGVTLPPSIAVNGSGGLILGPGIANGDWCNPSLNLSGGLDVSGTNTSNDAIWATEGKVLIGTGGSNSGISLSNIAISNTSPPATPTASLVGTFTGNTTNDVFSDGSYAYLATSTNSKEVQIVDLTKITNGKYSEIGYFNPSINGTGNSVFVLGNIGYVTVHANNSDTLYTFNLSSKTGSRPQLGSVNIAATGTKVYVVTDSGGTYAYVSIAGATQELQIIKVTNNGATLSIVGQADVNGGAANSVYVNSAGTRAYLATGNSSSLPEFFIIDVTSKTGNRGNIGTYDAAGMDPHQVTIVPPPGNFAILVGTGGEEYQVIRIKDNSGKEITPTRCGGLDVSSGINGVATVLEQDNDVFSYIYTRTSNKELQIIRGGPGGTNGKYTSTGVYTSQTIPAAPNQLTHDVAFNSFSVSETKPAGTSIQYKVSIKHAISGSCNSVNFDFNNIADYTGPYTLLPGITSQQLTLDSNGTGYENPGQCLRYQVILSTSDVNQTPVLNSIIFNYAP